MSNEAMVRISGTTSDSSDQGGTAGLQLGTYVNGEFQEAASIRVTQPAPSVAAKRSVQYVRLCSLGVVGGDLTRVSFVHVCGCM